jgi:hypothetical protein
MCQRVKMIVMLCNAEETYSKLREQPAAGGEACEKEEDLKERADALKANYLQSTLGALLIAEAEYNTAVDKLPFKQLASRIPPKSAGVPPSCPALLLSWKSGLVLKSQCGDGKVLLALALGSWKRSLAWSVWQRKVKAKQHKLE